MISRSHQQRPRNPLNTQELPKLSPVPAPIGRGMAFGVRQSVDERDLKLDLLTPQRRRGRQGLDPRKRLRQLFGSLDQR